MISSLRKVQDHVLVFSTEHISLPTIMVDSWLLYRNFRRSIYCMSPWAFYSQLLSELLGNMYVSTLLYSRKTLESGEGSRRASLITHSAPAFTLLRRLKNASAKKKLSGSMSIKATAVFVVLSEGPFAQSVELGLGRRFSFVMCTSKGTASTSIFAQHMGMEIVCHLRIEISVTSFVA